MGIWRLLRQRQESLFDEKIHIRVARNSDEEHPRYETATFEIKKAFFETFVKHKESENALKIILETAASGGEEVRCIDAGTWGKDETFGTGNTKYSVESKHFILELGIPLHGWFNIGLEHGLPENTFD